MEKFKLNETLEKDSHFVAKLNLCEVRIIDNSNFPWLILVPQRNNIVEITDLTSEDYLLLNEEILLVAKVLKTTLAPDKLNIAMLGNVVSQMHVHIIARYETDKLFPKPVWGGVFERYEAQKLKTMIDSLRQKLLQDL